ncbi:MAG: histidine phosphatase family protein [Bacillaceae bacterium]
MTKICLVRHGQTDWNFQGIIQGHEDIPLNDVGKKQAFDSALFLKNEKWDILIASPLQRAVETATIIGKEVGVTTVEMDERFIERNFGEVSGKYIIDAKHKITDNSAIGLEQEEEIQARCLNGLIDVAKRYEGKAIIIVAHSHAIKGILSAIDSSRFHFGIQLDNACANFLSYKNGVFHVNAFNVSQHITV